LLIQARQAQGKDAEMIAAAEGAFQVGGEKHPEIEFLLGSMYAAKQPTRKAEAIERLSSFIARACLADEPKWREQCDAARSLIRQLQH
jgi:hypothetical protein